MKDFALFERGDAVLLSSVVPCGLGHAGFFRYPLWPRARRVCHRRHTGAARGAAALENGRHWKALEGTGRHWKALIAQERRGNHTRPLTNTKHSRHATTNSLIFCVMTSSGTTHNRALGSRGSTPTHPIFQIRKPETLKHTQFSKFPDQGRQRTLNFPNSAPRHTRVYSIFQIRRRETPQACSIFQIQQQETSTHPIFQIRHQDTPERSQFSKLPDQRRQNIPYFPN